MLTGPESNINVILFLQYTHVYTMYHKIHFTNKICLKTKTSLKQNSFKTKYIKKQNIYTKSKNI